jgi:hypothetical protein
VFLDELTPIFNQATSHPISFLGGLFSGLLRLNLSDDPVKSWLEQQAGVSPASSTTEVNNGKGSGPQSISID